MELYKAIEKVQRLKSETEKINNWFLDLKVNSKPVYGVTWRKFEKAIENTLDDLYEELHSLEDKVKEATKDIEID